MSVIDKKIVRNDSSLTHFLTMLFFIHLPDGYVKFAVKTM